MTKQEKIKEVYGENYNPHNIDENGWIKYSLWMHLFKKVDADYDEFDNRNMIVRPNSLTGIENNNGWIKIEKEEDLPNTEGLYWLSSDKGYIKATLYPLSSIKPKYLNGTCTHYKLIQEPDSPLY